MRNETSRDFTCDCTYEAVGIEDGLARPVLLALAKPKTLPTDCSYLWMNPPIVTLTRGSR